MSFNQFYRSAIRWMEGLDFQQVTLLSIVIVAIGFYCLRGFGSRSNY